jgi:hypothetical protein
MYYISRIIVLLIVMFTVSLIPISCIHAQTIPSLLGQYPNFPPTHAEGSGGEVPPLLATLFGLFFVLIMVSLSILALFSLRMDFAHYTATVKSVIVGVLFFAATSTLAVVITYHLFFMK